MGAQRAGHAVGDAPLRTLDEEYTVREAEADEAGPVLKRYVAVAGKTRPQFDAAPDDPAEAFAAEADRHPVFELQPAA